MNTNEIIKADTPVEVVPQKSTTTEPTATMRHPHTGHTVEATQPELVGLMYRGYEQIKK